MIFNERAIPPAFVVDAIAGGPELREAVVAARATIDTAGEVRRRASDRFLQSANGSLDNATPRAGVTRAALNKILDDHAKAEADLRTADHAHTTALRRLHDAVREGMRTEAFQAAHETLADAAHDRAVEALNAFEKAFAERNEFNAAIGRKVEAPGFYDHRYYISGLRDIVNAPILDARQRAINELNSSTMTPAQRIEFAKRNGLVPA
jgi:hypothetical protein